MIGKPIGRACFLVVIFASALFGQDAGRFDAGKMWTFEYAPRQYFSKTYKFDASDQWFEKARLAAVRIPGCSASFVSPDGLLPEIVERTDHPWFIGVQFHPELKSKPFEPHPLFASFIAAAMEQSRLV